MNAFINEDSIGDYVDLTEFLRLILLAKAAVDKHQGILYKDSEYFRRPEFKQRFGRLRLPMDMKALATQLVFGATPVCWRPNRLSSDDGEYVATPPASSFCDVSICEAGEEAISDQDAYTALVSAADSPFGSVWKLDIERSVDSMRVCVRNASNIDEVHKWISENPKLYDFSQAVERPTDFQTILVKDTDRFERTSYVERNGGRRIYRERDSGNFYYVDFGHPGGSAHLEVFSRRRLHLGTADIEAGVLDESKRVEGRDLKI